MCDGPFLLQRVFASTRATRDREQEGDAGYIILEGMGEDAFAFMMYYYYYYLVSHITITLLPAM